MTNIRIKPLLASAHLATSTPALAAAPLPELVEGSCISVTDADGCVFERNVNEHNAVSLAQAYNAAHALPHLDFYTSAASPEPSNWAMLIAGFGLIDSLARQRRLAAA